MFLSLIKKDLTEHGWVMLFFFTGVVLAVLLALPRNQQVVGGVSALQLVRTALFTLLPLITFIMGQRLIVAEYLGKTRQFAESLPVTAVTLVNVKFVFGLLYTSLLAVLVLALSAWTARVVDSIDGAYLLLLAVKTLSMSALLWSLVFCFSFCGFIRITLYICVVLLILVLINNPLFDVSRFGPFALMDAQLFVFEREQYPWPELFQTWALTLGLVICAYALALFNEGSIAEVLAKPMSRRDIVLSGLIAVAGVMLLGGLLREPGSAVEPPASARVLRSSDPQVAVHYRSEQQADQAQSVLQTIVSSLQTLHRDLGMDSLAAVRIAQDNTLSTADLQIDAAAPGNVAIRANFASYDSYRHSTLAAVVLHEVLQQQANRRLIFEPYHWILDGVTRWWVEARSQPLRAAHHEELIALAGWAAGRLDAHWTLSRHWQLITDRVGYPAAEALAYSAISFLARQRGDDVVDHLAITALLPWRSGSSLTTVRSWADPAASRFGRITGWQQSAFFTAWREWLDEAAAEQGVAARLAAVPPIQGRAELAADGNKLVLSMHFAGSASSIGTLSCRVQYERISAFDYEMAILLEEQQTVPCKISDYELSTVFGSGERVYLVLEMLSESFHTPLRIWQDRVSMP